MSPAIMYIDEMETEWKTKMELSTYLHEWITQMTEVKGRNIPEDIFMLH